MCRGLVAPLKHLKVYIKIVKQQLGVSGFFGKGERLFKVLFNDKEIKKKPRGRITGRWCEVCVKAHGDLKIFGGFTTGG